MMILGKYKVIEFPGGYIVSSVYRSYDDEERRVTVKKVVFDEGSKETPSAVLEEVSLLKQLEHQNIMRLVDVQNNEEGLLVFYDEWMDLYLEMFIRKKKKYKLDSDLIKKFVHQILQAISYCHSHKIIHGALRPRSLAVALEGSVVKIADFGMECPRQADSSGERMLFPEYRAPELLLGSKQYSEAIDLWSVGCIFAEMVTRKPLFHNAYYNNSHALYEIFSLLGLPSETSWPGVTKLPCYVFGLSQFQGGEPKQIDFATGLEPDGLDLLNKMICLNPASRITAEDALNHAYFQNV